MAQLDMLDSKAMNTPQAEQSGQMATHSGWVVLSENSDDKHQLLILCVWCSSVRTYFDKLSARWDKIGLSGVQG